MPSLYLRCALVRIDMCLRICYKVSMAKIDKAFGSRVRKLRGDRFPRQRDLAKVLDRPEGQVSKIEQGYVPGRTEQLQQLADALGTTVHYLLTGSEPVGVGG